MTRSAGSSTTVRLGEFVVHAAPPAEARARAAVAVLDTIAVALAGASEPVSRIARDVVAGDSGDACTVLGSAVRARAPAASLINGTAAHALDYDDMCFVSLAHPSAPLVPAALAAAEVAHATGRGLLEAYVVGFEIEGRLGSLMNPRHYQRGWHCTSTLGTIGAAAAVARLLGLDAIETGHALAIAASEASGLKENFGTMVKPLHAGLAARNGVLAALLARAGMTASALALDGPQGFLAAMDSERTGLCDAIADLGARWEIVESGITVKLYPSCAGTHPTLDAILDLRRAEGFGAGDVERIDVDVDSIAPKVLIYDRPSTGLEAKFSMPFCAAAAAAHGEVGIETFEAASLADPAIAELMPRVTMRVDPSFDGAAPPLTQARVTVRLRNGRELTRQAAGARGYPANPASEAEMTAKFLACAARALPPRAAASALELLRTIDRLDDLRTLMAGLAVATGSQSS